MITIQLHGRLTRDPELRELEDGTKLAALRIAANDSRGRVVYLNCAEFGKSGEAAARTLSKGSEVVSTASCASARSTVTKAGASTTAPSATPNSPVAATATSRPPRSRARLPIRMTSRSKPKRRAAILGSPRAPMFAMVIIEDRVDEGLAGHGGHRYMGPPQRITDARELVRIVLGATAPPAGLGPWRRAIAGVSA
jgi:hypothetical protein